MKPGALFLFIVIVAGLCFACTGPEVTSRNARAPLCTAGSSGAADAFAGSFQVLKTTSTYNPSTANLMPPAATDISDTLANLKGSVPYTGMWQTLHDAFQQANPPFQKRLCNLSGVYIDERACAGGGTCSGPNSWGFRNPNNDPMTGNPSLTEYIGISAQLWDANGVAPVFSKYETNLLAQVMATLGMPWPSGINAPTFQTASSGGYSVDTQAAAVLAALAHEYGHVLWADLVKVQPGQNYAYAPSQYCMDKTNGFFNGSWSQASQPTYFVSFASTSAADQHSNPPQIADLKSAITGGASTLKTAAQLLYEIYAAEYDDNDNYVNPAGVWPSLFGAVSPEEDFVESFVVHIMSIGSSVGVDSMQLNIYTATGAAPPVAQMSNLFQDFAKQPTPGYHARKDTLVKKVKTCIDNDTRW